MTGQTDGRDSIRLTVDNCLWLEPRETPGRSQTRQRTAPQHCGGPPHTLRRPSDRPGRVSALYERQSFSRPAVNKQSPLPTVQHHQTALLSMNSLQDEMNVERMSSPGGAGNKQDSGNISSNQPTVKTPRAASSLAR